MAGVFAIAAVGGSAAIAFAGSGGGNPPTTTATGRDANNPAAKDPGFPGKGKDKPYPHDPESVGPCGVKWKDIYIDPDGYAYGSTGDAPANSNSSPDNCHVLSKAEVEQQKQLYEQYPNGAPADYQATSATSSTMP